MHAFMNLWVWGMRTHTHTKWVELRERKNWNRCPPHKMWISGNIISADPDNSVNICTCESHWWICLWTKCVLKILHIITREFGRCSAKLPSKRSLLFSSNESIENCSYLVLTFLSLRSNIVQSSMVSLLPKFCQNQKESGPENGRFFGCPRSDSAPILDSDWYSTFEHKMFCPESKDKMQGTITALRTYIIAKRILHIEVLVDIIV